MSARPLRRRASPWFERPRVRFDPHADRGARERRRDEKRPGGTIRPIEAAKIRDGGKAPLFRSAVGRTGALTEKPMNRVDAWRMIQRRAADLGTRVRIGCHTFRATVTIIPRSASKSSTSRKLSVNRRYSQIAW